MRSKDATKVRILDAAKAILARDGFEGLKINSLADEAGVGKPLIYRYFAGMGGVVKALAHDANVDMSDSPHEMSHAGGDEVLHNLVSSGRSLASNRLARDLLLWSLASNNAPDLTSSASVGGVMADGASSQSNISENKDDDKQAVYAILKAAISFVVLYRDRHDYWAQLPIKTPNNMARLERALAKIVAKVWV
jgi:AcrR family transcriptional regulator